MMQSSDLKQNAGQRDGVPFFEDNCGINTMRRQKSTKRVKNTGRKRRNVSKAKLSWFYFPGKVFPASGGYK